METKTIKEYTFNGFGVPVILRNAPFSMRLGEWVLDVDLMKLRPLLLYAICHKPYRLTGAEVKFLRTYYEYTTTEFGKLFAVSHAAVSKWEGHGQQLANITPTTEVCMRLFALDQFKIKNGPFRDLYHFVVNELVKSDKKTPKRLIPPAFDVLKKDCPELISI